MPDIFLYIAVFIVLLVPLMIIHELGHFWGAKAGGVRVEEFGIGFPPRAIKLFERGGTIYSLNWLPIGAFVKMTGEDDPSDPHSLAAAKKRWRLITLAAGPIMNFIGAFVIFTAAFLFFETRPTDYQFRIRAVRDDSVAQSIGIKPGDVIMDVDGKSMLQTLRYNGDELESPPTNQTLREAVLAAEAREIVMRVNRPVNVDNPRGAFEPVTLRAKLPAGLDRTAPLGVELDLQVTKAERLPTTVPAALRKAAGQFERIVTTIINLPGEMARRNLSAESARPIGPVGITRIGVNLVQNRDIEGWFPFVMFAGFISFALGATNLLPLPALDGGRIVFVLIEAIRGRRIDPTRQQWVHGMGFVLLIGLSLVMLVLDVIRPIVP
jgi:regulator of sigma E protease